MLTATGLRTHIWNNNLKSVILLALFPVLLLIILYAVMLLTETAAGTSGVAEGLARSAARLPQVAPWAVAGAGGWFAVAYVGHGAMINLATGARALKREDDPRTYNLLENLCISRGVAMPALSIIEDPSRNAFASGLNASNYRITVTRGLLESLEDDELEAVLAHELSHIRHRDVRLLVIAVIFVGIISLVFEMTFRGLTRTHVTRTDRGRRSGGVNAGALILIAMAIRFALSRRREYMADAGAAELTKNPDAMVRALQKVAGHTDVKRAPTEVREMFLAWEPSGFSSLMATHPPIEKRIEALRAYGGALL